MPLSDRARTLPTGHRAVSHWNQRGVVHGKVGHVGLDGFPDEQQFPPAEWPDIVNPLEENRILEVVADSAGFVVNSSGELLGRQISPWHVMLRQPVG